MHIDVKQIGSLARRAGAAIMEIYAGEFVVETKTDESPLTAADRASHAVIEAGLKDLHPEIPLLSEEGKSISYGVRKRWQRFWVEDPLDGTKEFIKRNGEFTVNIALIEGNSPILGVIYAPAADRLYWGIKEEGAFVENGVGSACPIEVRRSDPQKGLTVVMSRSHPSPELAEFLQTVKVAEALSVGSSLKFCVVAEGKADLYPRLGPTMEWDTAAGQAILESAGGTVTDLQGGLLRYNKANLVNSHFVARAPMPAGLPCPPPSGAEPRPWN